VCVFSLSLAMSGQTPTVVEYDCPRPVTALAIDPLFARKKDQPFIIGGKSEQLTLLKKGFFGRKQTTLHQGEGETFSPPPSLPRLSVSL
jgi:vacuolar protein sorting-associated protein 41